MLKIYAMCCGRLEFDRSLFFPDETPGTRHAIEVPAFLIRHTTGTVLFDTGVDCLAQQDPVGRLGERIVTNFNLRAAPHENVIDQLASLGLRPSDVTHVINSHFHFDHCGCNTLFPHATFIVQRAEMEMARSPSSRYNPAYWDHPFDYRLVDGEHDLFGDGELVLIPTPGHTAGHQSLRVQAAPDVLFVLTADACYSRTHLEQEVIPQAVWDVPTMIESFRTLRAMQERQGCHLIFGHDPAQWASMRHAPDTMT
jgi:glyoxylase-like metal-dependent hydrolase (beta-lactamase superfamily II)